jgi:hypothetical protein
MDDLGVWVGAILTLLVFSYLIKDTVLFRIAQAIFVGVAIGYAATVAVRLVLVPKLIAPLLGNLGSANYPWVLFVPLILGLLLFAKLHTPWSALGNPSIAFLFGVGSALAIGGALGGALLPQLRALIVSLSPAQGLDIVINGLILVVGTLGSFLSFRFVVPTQPRPALRAFDGVTRAWGYVGRWFILVAFGAIFADTAVSRVSILVGRVYFLLHDWLQTIR